MYNLSLRIDIGRPQAENIRITATMAVTSLPPLTTPHIQAPKAEKEATEVQLQPPVIQTVPNPVGTTPQKAGKRVSTGLPPMRALQPIGTTGGQTASQTQQMSQKLLTEMENILWHIKQTELILKHYKGSLAMGGKENERFNVMYHEMWPIYRKGK